MPVTIGYLRVSTEEQDLDKNKADLLMLANAKQKILNMNFMDLKRM